MAYRRPVIDKKQESVFRQEAANWIVELERQHPLAGLPKHAPSILLNPSGHKMCVAVLCVAAAAAAAAVALAGWLASGSLPPPRRPAPGHVGTPHHALTVPFNLHLPATTRYKLVLGLSSLAMRLRLEGDSYKFADVDTHPRFPLAAPKDAVQARRRAHATRVHCARLAKRLVAHVRRAVTTQHVWRSYAAEIAMEWRKVDRARAKVAQERGAQPADILSEQSQALRSARVQLIREVAPPLPPTTHTCPRHQGCCCRRRRGLRQRCPVRSVET